MADPMKIRATLQGDTVEVRVLMQHEMETGQRKDAAGKTIPAWHIQQVTATNNGKPVTTSGARPGELETAGRATAGNSTNTPARMTEASSVRSAR